MPNSDFETYRILRFYERDHPTEVIKENVSREEAIAWCSNPETSSRTATSPEARARTARYGNWFDGYESNQPVRRPDGWPNHATREVFLWATASEENQSWWEQIVNTTPREELAAHLARELPNAITIDSSSEIDWFEVDWNYLANKATDE